METLSQLRNGDTFCFENKSYLIQNGIDPDQQPFTITSTQSPVHGYVYVRDKNGISYLLGPSHLAVNRTKQIN